MAVFDHPSIDPTRFAEIMRSLAGGVAVVTTLDEHDRPRGLTSTAVSSVSADPPLLLVCVATTSRTLPALRHRRRFVVNFMGAGADDACARFASKQEDKFAGVEWEPGPGGLPVLAGVATGWAECATVEEIGAGDHVILIGRVQDGAGGRDPAPPLVYYHRTYGSWTPLDGRAVAA